MSSHLADTQISTTALTFLIVALRRFTGLTQAAFAEAFGVGLETVQRWEAGTEVPDGPALALLRIVARRPGALLENLVTTG